MSEAEQLNGVPAGLLSKEGEARVANGEPLSGLAMNAPSLGTEEVPIVDGAAEAIPAGHPVFDIQSRFNGALAEYERGKAMLLQLDTEQAAINKEYNENRQTVARGLVRLEGAMTILKEQGAKAPEEKTT